ncbi:hypothetical protein C8Q73DRAFT_310353 [Cubamyces lactineus]|nr:hypothetical protein C8Q73DRAFT_310353 [Cubamyces lactineus]
MNIPLWNVYVCETPLPPAPLRLPLTCTSANCLAILSRCGLVMFWRQGRSLYRRPTACTAPTSTFWRTSHSHNRPVQGRKKAVSARLFGCSPDSRKEVHVRNEPSFLAIFRMSFERNMWDVCIRVEWRVSALSYRLRCKRPLARDTVAVELLAISGGLSLELIKFL